MRPVPIVYVTDMNRSLDWYRRLLPDAELVSTSEWWSELSSDGVSVALHGAESLEPGGHVGLAFEASSPLEDVVAALADGGIEPARAICDEPFGRSIVIQDPDGLKIQINEHDPEKYPGS